MIRSSVGPQMVMDGVGCWEQGQLGSLDSFITLTLAFIVECSDAHQELKQSCKVKISQIINKSIRSTEQNVHINLTIAKVVESTFYSLNLILAPISVQIQMKCPGTRRSVYWRAPCWDLGHTTGGWGRSKPRPGQPRDTVSVLNIFNNPRHRSISFTMKYFSFAIIVMVIFIP